MNEPEILPCCKCGEKPRYSEVYGMYYLQCIRCEKTVVCLQKKNVYTAWNGQNERAVRYASKKKKEPKPRKPGPAMVWELSSTGRKVRCFKSMTALARELGLGKGLVCGKFYRSKKGRIEIEGVRYALDRA